MIFGCVKIPLLQARSVLQIIKELSLASLINHTVRLLKQYQMSAQYNEYIQC